MSRRRLGAAEAAAALKAEIKRLVDLAPPLTEQQRDSIRHTLSGVVVPPPVSQAA